MDPRDELSRRLWLLREQMLQLLCALEIQQLVIANQRLRWLGVVSENVEHIRDDIRVTEAERITVSRQVCRGLGLADDASLAEMIDAADEPHGSLWRQTRHQLVGLQAEIDQVTSASQQLIRRGLDQTSTLMHTIHGAADGPETYDPAGSATRLGPSTSRFDRSA